MADNAVINQPNPQPCLIFLEQLDGGNHFTSSVDDDNFPQNPPAPLNAPWPFHDLTHIQMLGDHNGYQLFFGDVLRNQTKRAVIWNLNDDFVVRWDIPIINHQHNVVGLAFRPDTPVPALVKLCVDENDIDNFGQWRVRVSLSTLNQPGVWIDVDENGVIYCPPFRVDSAKNCINGVIYFRARDLQNEQNEGNFFITFDLDGGIVGDVRPQNPNRFSSLKVNGSLRLLEYHDGVCDVWDGPDEFIHLYTVPNVRDGDVLGFRDNGQALVKRRNAGVTNVGVYDPGLQQIIINDIGINERPYTKLSVTPYIGNAN